MPSSCWRCSAVTSSCWRASFARFRVPAGAVSPPGWWPAWPFSRCLAIVLRWLWMPGGSELFYLRARQPSSGLSPVVSLALVTLAFFAWTLMELKRRRLMARQAIAWPLRWKLDPPLEGSEQIAAPLQAQLERTLPPLRKEGTASATEWAEGRWFWLAQVLILLPPTVMLMRVVQPICESVFYGRLLIAAFVAVMALAAVAFHQFFALWLELHRLLSRLDRTRLLAALERISPVVAWSPMRAFGWQLPNFKMLVLSAEWLGKVEPETEPVLKGELEAVFRADLEGDLAAETRARRVLNRTFADAGARLAERAGEAPVLEYFALRLVAFLGPVISHMRNCLAGAMLAALFLLFAVQAYAFEPQWFVSMGVWAALGVGVVLTLWVFVQMDRNATLSAIGGTTAGKLSFDRHLVANFLTYGALPLAGILVTQFPQVGRLVAELAEPRIAHRRRAVGSKSRRPRHGAPGASTVARVATAGQAVRRRRISARPAPARTSSISARPASESVGISSGEAPPTTKTVGSPPATVAGSSVWPLDSLSPLTSAS